MSPRSSGSYTDALDKVYERLDKVEQRLLARLDRFEERTLESVNTLEQDTDKQVVLLHNRIDGIRNYGIVGAIVAGALASLDIMWRR